MSDTSTASISSGPALAAGITASLGWSMKVIESTPEDKRFASPGEGKATPLWSLGHMAEAADMLGLTVGLGRPTLIPEPWRPLFMPPEFGGNPITADPADYPAWDEIIPVYREVMTAMAGAAAGLDDARLAGPPSGEVPPPLQAMYKTLGDGIMMAIMHDGHHRGQMAMMKHL